MMKYVKASHTVRVVSDYEIISESTGEDKVAFRLVSSVPIKSVNGEAFAEFTLQHDKVADFMLQNVSDAQIQQNDFKSFVTSQLFETVRNSKLLEELDEPIYL